MQRSRTSRQRAGAGPTRTWLTRTPGRARQEGEVGSGRLSCPRQVAQAEAAALLQDKVANSLPPTFNSCACRWPACRRVDSRIRRRQVTKSRQAQMADRHERTKGLRYRLEMLQEQ